MFEYQLIRSTRRKSLLLQVKYGKVIVRAPQTTALSFINDFIRDKSSWLQIKISEQQSEDKLCSFEQGSTLLILGEEFILNIAIAKRASVFVETASSSNEACINVQTPLTNQLNVMISEKVNGRLLDSSAKAKQVKKQLEGYLKQKAEQIIIERLEVISEKTLLKPVKTKIRQYRSRWGSCNNRGEVSFNYLLMMTPLFVIDYVIVHELCHLKHLNHSKDFWSLVETHSPHFKDAKKWLRLHQSQLHWQY